MLADSDLNSELIARYKLWLSALDYSIPTQRRYPRIVREFCQSAGAKAVIRTTPWDVRKFLIEETRRGLRYGTVRDLLVVLRNFSEFLGLGNARTNSRADDPNESSPKKPSRRGQSPHHFPPDRRGTKPAGRGITRTFVRNGLPGQGIDECESGRY